VLPMKSLKLAGVVTALFSPLSPSGCFGAKSSIDAG
jgi:hypothetical protein